MTLDEIAIRAVEAVRSGATTLRIVPEEYDLIKRSGDGLWDHAVLSAARDRGVADPRGLLAVEVGT